MRTLLPHDPTDRFQLAYLKSAKMIDDASLQRMKLTAYEAATDASKWQLLADDLRRTFHATSVYLGAASPPGKPQNRWLIDSGTSNDAISQYTSQWSTHDPWTNHAKGHAISQPGRCFIGSEFLPWPELERTAFYNDFGRGHGLKGLMSALVDDGHHPSGTPRMKLALFRENGLPEFESSQLEAFRALQPALRHALHAHWALHQLQSEASAIDQSFGALPSPVFILRQDLRIDFANPAALALDRGWVTHAGSGVIDRIAQLESAALRELQETAGRGVPVEAGLWMTRTDGQATATLHLARIPPGSAISSHWPRSTTIAMIHFDDAKRNRETLLLAMTHRFKLTATERRVLQRLAGGATAQQVAQTQALALNTVRTHIRHLLDKTGNHRLVDLLRQLGA